MQALRPTSSEQPSFTKYFLQDPTLLQNINQRQKKKIVLYDLPQIESFRRLNKPVVSQQKKRMIKEKLDLEQQSLMQTKQRQRRNEYFLNYSENPFIELSPHTKPSRVTNISKPAVQSQLNITVKQPAQQLKQQSKPEQQGNLIYDIVTELNSISAKSPKPQFVKLKDDFRKLMKEADLFSNKIIDLSGKKEEFQFFKNKKLQTNELISKIIERGVQMANEKGKKSVEKDKPEARNRSNTLSTQDGKEQKKDVSNNPAVEKLPENTMPFEEIIAIKQENYFMRPDPHSQKPFNIFKLAFNKNQKQIIGKQLLDKYNFSFTSMVEKIQKIKIPIYRDISRMARRIALGITTGKEDRFDYIDSYELSFKTNALSFSDLMSVASGRFTSQFVYKTTNFDVQQNVIKETSETSSQEEEEQIFYDDNVTSMAVRFHNKGEQEQEILNYLKLEYNSKEVSYKQQCEKYKQTIHSDLKMKERLVSTTIQDKELHGVLNRSVKLQLTHFVNMDEKDVEIDRLIRMNKMNKNKNVAIKLEKVLEAFQLKKSHDHVIENLGIVEDDDDKAYNDDVDNVRLRTVRGSPHQRSKIYSACNEEEMSFTKTPQRRSQNRQMQGKTSYKRQANASRTPIKRQDNTSKTPQKRTVESNKSNVDLSAAKNTTAKKTQLWKF